MFCKEFIDKISLYIDGYLNIKEKQEVEKHINVCESCKKLYEDIMTIKIIAPSMKNRFIYEMRKKNYLKLALTFFLIIFIISGILFETKIFEKNRIRNIAKMPVKGKVINKREIEPVKIYYTDTTYEISYEEVLP